MIKWLRIVTAPMAGLLLFIVPAALLGDFILVSGMGVFTRGEPFNGLMMVFLPPLVGFLYGIKRVRVFHPFFNREYAAWLRTAPWAPGKELPNGPVLVLAQDLVVLAGVSLLTFFYNDGWLADTFRGLFFPLKVIIPFFAGFLLTTAVLFYFTGQRWTAYLMTFGLVSMVYYFERPLVIFLLEIIVYAVVLPQILRSVAIVYDNPTVADKVAGFYKTDLADLARKSSDIMRSGWPHATLAPNLNIPRMENTDCIAVSALVAWTVLVFFHWGNETFVTALCIVVIFAAALVRCAQYLPGARAPLGFWARFGTGRIIIRGYDHVFISPLVAAAIGMMLWRLMILNSCPPLLTTSGVFCAFLVLLAGKPDLMTWRLTGRFHGFASANSKARLNMPANAVVIHLGFPS